MLGFHCCFFCCFSITSEFYLYKKHTVPRKVKYKLFVAEQTLLILKLNLFKINCQLPGFMFLLLLVFFFFFCYLAVYEKFYLQYMHLCKIYCTQTVAFKQ